MLKSFITIAGYNRERRRSSAGEGATATDAPADPEAAAAAAVLQLFLRPARQAATRLQRRRRQLGRPGRSTRWGAAEAGEDVVVPEEPAPDHGILRGRSPAPDGHAAASGERLIKREFDA